MKYIEFKNLCQGKKANNYVRINGCSLVLIATVIFWAVVLWLFIGCRGIHNAPRGTGYITNPPAYLISEIPEEELPDPYKIESKKKPKDGKTDYQMLQYKRIYTFRK